MQQLREPHFRYSHSIVYIYIVMPIPNRALCWWWWWRWRCRLANIVIMRRPRVIFNLHSSRWLDR